MKPYFFTSYYKASSDQCWYLLSHFHLPRKIICCIIIFQSSFNITRWFNHSSCHHQPSAKLINHSLLRIWWCAIVIMAPFVSCADFTATMLKFARIIRASSSSSQYFYKLRLWLYNRSVSPSSIKYISSWPYDVVKVCIIKSCYLEAVQ